MDIQDSSETFYRVIYMFTIMHVQSKNLICLLLRVGKQKTLTKALLIWVVCRYYKLSS